jgi:predicted transcriptional regulator
MAKTLSDLQMQVMRVLWASGEASAADVQAALAAQRRLAPTTVATVLSRLEKQGLLAHRTVGRTYYYSALVSEPEVRRSMVAELLDRVFGGDPAALVSHLLAEKEITPAELEAVRRLLADDQPPDQAGEDDV